MTLVGLHKRRPIFNNVLHVMYCILFFFVLKLQLQYKHNKPTHGGFPEGRTPIVMLDRMLNITSKCYIQLSIVSSTMGVCPSGNPPLRWLIMFVLKLLAFGEINILLLLLVSYKVNKCWIWL